MKRGLTMVRVKIVTSDSNCLDYHFLAFIRCLCQYDHLDINKMADSLNKLNILQGSNGDYLLNNNITRNRATALIIRMLGKENYVKQNADKLEVYQVLRRRSKGMVCALCRGFSDLNSIVAGTRTDPSHHWKMSLKEFIKMALCAIGYEYGTDFDWTNVYQKAYEVGIVIGDAYASKTQDNYDYKRRKPWK